MQSKLPILAAVAGGILLLSRRSRHSHELDAFAPSRMEEDSAHTIGTAVVAAAAALAVGALVANRMGAERGQGSLRRVEESIELDVPVRTAYNQWTQFEEFPQFMDSVEEVKQLDDTHLHWRARVGGKPKEWDAEISEQIPDQRIAWRSTGGVRNDGAVIFEPLSPDRTRLVLRMEYEPESTVERIGSAVGGVRLTARGNLKRFKQLIESRGAETGAWRGTVAPH